MKFKLTPVKLENFKKCICGDVIPIYRGYTAQRDHVKKYSLWKISS